MYLKNKILESKIRAQRKLVRQCKEISDIIDFLVGHKEFHGLDFGKSMTIDLCGILEKN